MVDILGYRRKLGMIVPSVNTVALADAGRIGLTGVTVHVSDVFRPDSGAAAPSDDPLVDDAIRRMATRSPHSTALLLDEDFYSSSVQVYAQRASNLGLNAVVTPSAALTAALQRTALFKRAALLTPYSSTQSDLAKERVEAAGCRVVRVRSMDIDSQSAFAQTTFVKLREHFQTLLGDDVDGVIQLGHNLPLGKLVDNLEEDFGKPILAINQVCMWYMLRNLGVEDVVAGQGRLFLDF